MTRQNLARRMMVYVCGILFLSCGVVMNARTALGATLIVFARLVPVAPDGMVQTLSQRAVSARFGVVCSTAGSWPLWKSLRACRRIEREGSGHEAAVWN